MTELKKLLDELLSLHRMKSSGVLNVESEKRYDFLKQEIIIIGEKANSYKTWHDILKLDYAKLESKADSYQKENQELKDENINLVYTIQEKDYTNQKIMKENQELKQKNEKFKSVIENRIKELEIELYSYSTGESKRMASEKISELQQLLAEVGKV